MILLWSVTYLFLFLLNKNADCNRDIATLEDENNFKYRLLAVQPVEISSEDNEEEDDETEEENTDTPILEFESEANAAPSNHNYKQYVQPQIKSHTKKLKGKQSIKKKVRKSSSTKTPPRDFEEEINNFHMNDEDENTAHQKSNNRRKKNKGINKDKKTNFVKKYKLKFPIEDTDSTQEEEEEEETKEKKEKKRKVVIKKKLPHKNITSTSTIISNPHRPKQLKGTTVADNIPFTSRYKEAAIHTQQNQELLPVKIKKSIPFMKLPTSVPNVLNPLRNGQSERNVVPKLVRTRDVNYILSTKKRPPKVLIRKYRPMVNMIPLYARNVRRFKAGSGRHYDAGKILFGPHSAIKASCESVGSLSKFRRVPQLFDPATEDSHTSNNSYKKHGEKGHRPKEHDDVYSEDTSDFNNNVKFPPDETNQVLGAGTFLNAHKQPNEYPLEHFANTVHLTTIVPQVVEAEKQQQTVEDDVNPEGYDADEHEITAELAALHKQETDENIEAEEQADPLPDDESLSDNYTDGGEGSDTVLGITNYDNEDE